MNNRRVEELIPKAIKYIEDNKQEFKHKSKNGIDKVYSGYLSSLGPTILLSGIKQSISFYKGDKEKKKILKLLENILNKNISNYNTIEIKLNEKRELLDAIVACKLAIKTFDLKE